MGPRIVLVSYEVGGVGSKLFDAAWAIDAASDVVLQALSDWDDGDLPFVARHFAKTDLVVLDARQRSDDWEKVKTFMAQLAQAGKPFAVLTDPHYTGTEARDFFEGAGARGLLPREAEVPEMTRWLRRVLPREG